MEDSTLTAVDKILLADIDSFTGQGSSFFKCNATIAKEQGCSISTVKRALSKLMDRGLVEQVSYDGRTRHLRSKMNREMDHPEPSDGSKWSRLPAQNEPIDIQSRRTSIEPSTSMIYGALDTEDFRAAWRDWKEYKSIEHKFKFKSAITEQVALNKLITDTNGNTTTAIDAIRTSIANGWKGLFARPESSHRDRPADPGRALEWAES